VISSSLNSLNKKESRQHKKPPIIIVGNGPVGVRAASLILEKDCNASVTIFGEESSLPYNRVQLSLYLAGSISKEQLANPVFDKQNQRLQEHIGESVIQIDRFNKTVTSDSGISYEYSKLILALGSSPITPNIENIQLDGVCQFRTFQDVKKLLKSKEGCKNIFIVGSGPLGLETASAMKQPNNIVTLQVRDKLLSNEVGPDAQLVLSDYLTASGIKLIVKNPAVRVIGENKVEAVKLANGDIVACEVLIFCSGIKPNTKLASDAGIDTQRGIVVDQDCVTNDQDVYAIGECCEYQKKTHGVVYPGFKQALNCANHIVGKTERKRVEQNQIQVKFDDYTTTYFGELDREGSEVFSYSNRLKGIYRKLVIHNKRLVGAIIIGNWSEQHKVQQTVEISGKINKKALLKFENNGLLFGEVKSQSVKDLPEDYLVCLCESVSRGELSAAITAGCRTVETLGQSTKAGVTCGSCKPLMANLLDEPALNLVMRHQKAILWTSLLSIFLIVLTVLFEPLSINQTVQLDWHLEKLWFDSFWKQVSGYGLLGLCVIAAALGLRKRWKKINFGHVDLWRYVHSIIGVAALILLMIHTGVRMGSNLNFVLMTVFLAATMTGSLVGVFMTKNHHWSDLKLAKHRLWWSRVHHTLLWMLPPLLGFHILTAYYF